VLTRLPDGTDQRASFTRKVALPSAIRLAAEKTLVIKASVAA
jgi:hypothetical protein